MQKRGEKRLPSPVHRRQGSGREGWTEDQEREARAHNRKRFVPEAVGPFEHGIPKQKRPGLIETEATAWREAMRKVQASGDALEPHDPRLIQAWRKKLRRKRALLSGFLRPRGERRLPPIEPGSFDAEPLEPREENAGPAGYCPPAFAGMLSPVEKKRLEKNRARVRLCRKGAAVEIEHNLKPSVGMTPRWRWTGK